MIGLAPVKAFLAANKLRAAGIILLVVVLVLSGCYVAVTRAYRSIYDAGYHAGKIEVDAQYKDAIIAHQAEQLKLQKQIMADTTRYNNLFDLYRQMEAQGPKEIVRYVREDPAFAASKRPARAHAQRVRELQSLREAAATH